MFFIQPQTPVNSQFTQILLTSHGSTPPSYDHSQNQANTSSHFLAPNPNPLTVRLGSLHYSLVNGSLRSASSNPGRSVRTCAQDFTMPILESGLLTWSHSTLSILDPVIWLQLIQSPSPVTCVLNTPQDLFKRPAEVILKLSAPNGSCTISLARGVLLEHYSIQGEHLLRSTATTLI